MKVDLRTDFEKLFDVVSDREKRKYEYRLERQALRIKQSLEELEDLEEKSRRPRYRLTYGPSYGGGLSLH